MAWVGTGAVWTLSSGVLKGSALGQIARASMMPHGNGGAISDVPLESEMGAAGAHDVVVDNFRFSPLHPKMTGQVVVG